MTKHIKLKAGGEVALPTELLDALGWQAGMTFEVNEHDGSITIRPLEATKRERINYEEFRRRVPKHEGAPVSLEEMQKGIDEAMAERWARKEARSR